MCLGLVTPSPCFSFCWNNNKKHLMYASAAKRFARSKLCVRLKSKTTVIVPLIRVVWAAALLFIVKPLYCQTDGNCFDSFALRTSYTLSRLCLDAEHCFSDAETHPIQKIARFDYVKQPRQCAVSKIECKISSHI